MNGNDASGLAGAAPFNKEPRAYDWQRGPEDRRDRGESEAAAEAVEHFADYLWTILLELEGLLLRKQKDYGPGNISNAPGGALNGLMVRMNDKMERLKTLVYSTVEPNNESIDDSLMDLANYCVIALMVRRGTWPK